MNFIKPLIFYRYYRIFLENKIVGIRKIRKEEIFPNKITIINSIKSRNTYFTGMSSFFIAVNLPNIFSKFFDSFIPKDLKINLPHIVILFPIFIVSYPFLLNSNRKVINDKNFISIKNPINLIKLIFDKRNYRGLIYHMLSSIVYYIPIANFYFHNKFESIRFSYVFGKNEIGLKFTSYKEAKKFIVNNNSITKGRGAFNTYLIGYYITLGCLCYEEYHRKI